MIPALVAEKIVRTRIDGAQIAYVLHINTPKGLKEHEVNPGKTRLYASLEEVRMTMMSSAETAIGHLIAAASAAASELGGNIKQEIPPPEIGEVAQVTLDDGRVAKIRMT